VGSNDDAYPGAPKGFSEIFQAVRSNVTYHVAVDGYGGTGGAMFLSYDFTPGTLFLVSASASGAGSVSPSSVYVQSNGVVSLTAVAGTNSAFDSWNGAAFSLANPLNIVVTSNLNLSALFVSSPPTDGFESGDFSVLGWKAAGNSPWSVQNSVVSAGAFAARSGSISNNQYSSLILTTNFGPGQGSFSYRVSSEATWATLNFYIDGILLRSWSGDVPWANYAFPLTTGTHTLEWRYAKTLANVVGLDAAFIDNVTLPILIPLDSSSRATLAFTRQSDGTPALTVFGQTNQVYTVQTSTDLSQWNDVMTATAVNGYLRVLDPSGFTNAPAFYRALVP
jgi:hypothetical protein